ncbi:tail fiber assembly protein [Xenorhabdus bovienii]|uniref:tail fiber assembly protein n=1 Tax=Xenorhabdus bovienii TaxID=40576 RepID=UPI0023B2FFE0|nr:tail fiber assembly protein [Xenorhabdus bovienii]MDE9483174.1 tail fiber assembly protein [Xenorhabdus bovienii]
MSELVSATVQNDKAVADAKSKQKYFLSEARIESKKQLDILEQQMRLKQLQWDMYCVKLLELDFSTAPDINWPKAPK